jgi:hypothetical protein
MCRGAEARGGMGKVREVARHPRQEVSSTTLTTPTTARRIQFTFTRQPRPLHRPRTKLVNNFEAKTQNGFTDFLF